MTYYILSFLVLCLSLEMIFYIQKLETLQLEYRSLSAHVHGRKRENCPEQTEATCVRDNTSGNSRPIVNAFSVSDSRSVSPAESQNKLHNYAKIHFNEGTDFNADTGTFSCSKPGVYYFTASLIKKRAYENSEKVDLVHCIIYKNTETMLELLVDPNDGPKVDVNNISADIGSTAVTNSMVVRLERGDTVYLGDCDNPLTSLEPYSSFSGFLLYQDVGSI
ncbi:complement C1q tumor necrosis factor-related protein 5-like isoform X2 [Ruditapes philippinarum]|uniref:complement C1q tumor necrosis factor-related protein 5-like isoform X2 n=1 Tax=Ruditapes philippinarum TaxID=129788 RepID=UPI00295BF83E|nr:complement C1q tumor necrosis factor-related protein 5-like isoform X2 [Ruditapes philippinarum]